MKSNLPPSLKYWSHPPDTPRICKTIDPGKLCPWPDDCYCAREERELRAKGVTSAVVAGLVVAALVLAFGLWYVNRAEGVEVCLTHEQARAKWPRDHLYWHTAARCWDNERSRRGDKEYLTPEAIDAVQYREEAERRLRTCCWPPLE